MLIGQKPKIGFLGLMQGLYDHSQPELPAYCEAYARDVIKQLSDAMDIDFPGAAKDRATIEKYVKHFNDMQYDGIIIVNLFYSPGMRLVQAFEKNTLPILLANIQPLPNVTDDWNWTLLTTNQGIHGIQDTSNMLMRMGLEPVIITDDWKSDHFHEFVKDWALASMTAVRLKRTKVAMFGRMPNMGDILGDDAAFYRVFGIEVNFESIGDIYKLMEKMTDREIDAQIEEDRKNFEIDPKLPAESHRYAACMQLAFEKFLKEKGYDGFSQYFNVYKDDGRFKQIPILGGSSLLAKGYGYSAEGDTHVLALTMMGHLIAENPHFTEMYSLDFGRDAAMMSHMGEGNWKVARKDRPVKLIDRPLDIGELGNPPTPKFSAEPGVATLISLVAVEGEHYRLIVSRGTNLDTQDIPGIPMNFTFFRPDSGIRAAMDSWLKYGGTHHEVMFLGDVRRRFEMLCQILDVEYIEV